MHKLLIIEDEIETRDALCHYFPWNELGFEVVGQYDNGRQALEYIKTDPPEVVFSDIKMPVMNGIELAEELFQMKCRSKVIFLSGYADFEFAKQAMVYGVKDYILKPAKYKELIEVFSRIKKELEATDSEQSSGRKADRNEIREYNYDEEVISTIKQYIEVHFKVATLYEAATLVRMNPSYLSHFFKQKTGQNFSQFLLNVRMEKAATQLMDVQHKIYDVSENVGYSNPKNFTRTFKNHFGKTPMEFRKGTEHEN
ncbi:response regulator transcription factor [Paenibacillus abyssi]|uniref:DNA-binding response regulator n=1 Tax=Paenibacillus abyssi TaxID=1340531 RepID=A0A917LFC4_9BACL|nr:response regulator [Paenibacillus abyssi]GGG18934.1 DNA-binding response regulator [Paenibacillus abyssi]